MSRYAVFGGSVNAEGAAKALQHLFRAGYASGLAVSQRGAGANMSVDVSVGGGLHVSGAGVAYFGFDDAVENVAVTAANPTNPRRDIVVSYIDLSLITTASTNNLNALKFLVVAGTPSASPSDPSAGTIQAAVGAGNPYNQLARIAVAAGATTVVNANITDLRNPMALAVPYLFGGGSNSKGHLVPNVADDTLALLNAAQTLTNKTLNSPVLSGSPTFDDGSPVGEWWEEIGRATLAVAGDTITISSLPPRKYLRIVGSMIASGQIVDTVRFNSDSAGNYNLRESTNAAAEAFVLSQTSLSLASIAASVPTFWQLDIINIATKEKLVMGHWMNQGPSGAADLPYRRELAGKWANASNQINRIDVVNAGTGDFAVGSEVIVLGHN